VKLSYSLLVFTMALIWSIAASAAPTPKEKEKEKEHEGKLVDSGSFGVFQKGHRVGTETFSIYQTGNGSVVYSEFKTENTPPDLQSSEMQLTPNGEIRRYEWREESPEKAESTVVPNSDFLNQKWRTGSEDKDHEQPYLLPPATTILDDYFFIHRELLAWKYLGMACKQDKGQVQCPMKQHVKFPTMNPHQHSSATLEVESLGMEKVTINGAPVELNKIELKNDAGTWQVWLDDHWKVMRMTIVGENTDVVRD
jgi:hypothetical protein